MNNCPTPSPEIACSGEDEDCDGAERITDEWDLAGDNVTCDLATRLFAGEGGTVQLPEDPQERIVIRGANHAQVDVDYYRIDANLLAPTGPVTRGIEFTSGPGVRRLVQFSFTERVCTAGTSADYLLFAVPAEEISQTIEFVSLNTEFVYMRVFAVGEPTCADGYSFTLGHPDAPVPEFIAVDGRARFDPGD
jgi:hypothetical protein